MGRPHDTDAAGRPVDLIGKPLEFRLAPIPGTGVGVRVIGAQEQAHMAKADRNGEYVLNGNYFTIKQGDPLPDGAEMVDEPVSVRKQDAAPENRAKSAAPETKSKKAN